MFNTLHTWLVQLLTSPWRMRILLTALLIAVMIIAVALPGGIAAAGPQSGGPDGRMAVGF